MPSPWIHETRVEHVALNTLRLIWNSRLSTPRCRGTRFFQRLNSNHFLSLNQIAHLLPFAEELCKPYLIHRIIELEDMEFVVYDAICGNREQRRRKRDQEEKISRQAVPRG
jgi:hypothetical protein